MRTKKINKSMYNLLDTYLDRFMNDKLPPRQAHIKSNTVVKKAPVVKPVIDKLKLWQDMQTTLPEVMEFQLPQPESKSIEALYIDCSPKKEMLVHNKVIEVKPLKSVKNEVKKVSDVEIINYSEKAIAIIGNTIRIKDKIAAIGGRYNPNLTVKGNKVAGWILPVTKLNYAQSIIN